MMEEKTMKKLFALLLAIVMIVSMTACVQPDDPTDPPQNNPTDPAQSNPTNPTEDPALLEAAKYGGHLDFCVYAKPTRLDPAKATGQAVVIVPGGGYYKLSMKYDGFMIAQYLRSIGVSAIVVKYRLPNNGHREVALEDAQAGLRFMRTQGVKWGVDPKQVGILGCSAGGYLAGHASTVTPDDEKPAFSILIYPVISGMTRSRHRGTFGQMLGEGRTHSEQEAYTLENLVSATTPPTLLLHTHDDVTVESTHATTYYKALKYYGVKASLRIFPTGKHGWAGHDDYFYAEPIKEAIADWLKIMYKPKK
jgi:acetyl esterase/lipase